MQDIQLNDEFFSTLDRYSYQLKKDINGFFDGSHLTNKHGQSIDFADFREYSLGDDIKRIDWNLYARFEKYFIKLYNDQKQANIRIYLDCSASMGYKDKYKGKYSIALASALGYLAITNQDNITFHLINKKGITSKVEKITNKKAFFKEVKKLNEINFSGNSDISNSIINDKQQNILKKPDLVIIISDFLLDNYKKAIEYFKFQNSEVILIQVLSKQEVEPQYIGRYNFIDSEDESIENNNFKININKSTYKAYKKAIEEIKEEIKLTCSKLSAKYFYTDTSIDVQTCLFKNIINPK